ncbi:hypothetical protein [Pseudoroseomonas ludipueritiae]|uniref:hypothetical protein n=1 Tax=Pseudoroseomonas ludipueritiae TaxID=198093 RepID=UPI001932EA03|nr:hypothetical protein [Pseudoroseomonas ludipueritiae]MCG7359783.1 hypothetical protein [Roseomonas sp. ACRSG]
MFESNFPVAKGSYGYVVLWDAFKRLAAGASADEKMALSAERPHGPTACSQEAIHDARRETA